MKDKRPVTIEEMLERSSRFSTDEGVELGLAFQPRPTDVFITPYPKSGTTWVQQLVHGLRTRGSMRFDEITEVVPWLELAHDLGLDIHDEQAAQPRAYKSHLDYDSIPKGGRYINVHRDPRDVLLSFHRFFDGWLFESGAISLHDFAMDFFLQRDDERDYWDHAASWWRQRDRDDVLLLCYEHMKQDLPGTVARIAEFIGVELDPALHDLVVRQSSIDFMRAHGAQFDDHLVREARDEVCGLPAGGDSSKVRAGRVGDAARELSADVVQRLDQRWQETMTAEFGLQSYPELMGALGR